MSRAFLVAGLGFGDEGKGTTVDFLAREHGAKRVVRYNGGAQAGHNVVTPDGRHHMFSQFGSGTFVPGVETHLSRHMLVNPITMTSEEKHLRTVGVEDAFDRMTIEDSALVTNPFQVSSNRIREVLRGGGRHGSCGMGIGETMADFIDNPDEALRIGDLSNTAVTAYKLKQSRKRKIETFSRLIVEAGGLSTEAVAREWALINDQTIVDDLVARYQTFTKLVRVVDAAHLPRVMTEGTTLFEGAQGVLLDQDFGFHPHTTWTTITFANALDLLQGFTGKVTKLGILRGHSTRHGAGPFPTEDPSIRLSGDHNDWGEWQQNFRVGYLDLVLSRYSVEALGGVDELVLTHLDLFSQFKKVCVSYGEGFPVLPEGPSNTQGRLEQQERNGKGLFTSTPVFSEFPDVDALLSGVEKKLKAPVTLCSYGPTAKDKKAR